jgi:hypothetical protein
LVNYAPLRQYQPHHSITYGPASTALFDRIVNETENSGLTQRSKELAEINLKLAQSATNTMVTSLDM